jgi:hypothetical protein
MPMIDEDLDTPNEGNNNNTINRYRLRLLAKTKNIPAPHDDPKSRTVNIHEPYQFLFDAQFPTYNSSISKRRIRNSSQQIFP